MITIQKAVCNFKESRFNLKIIKCANHCVDHVSGTKSQTMT